MAYLPLGPKDKAYSVPVTFATDEDGIPLPADPLGANADAVVAAGAAGSLSAKLRRLTTDLGALIGLPTLAIPTLAAETVVAGAASVLGKIGTVPAGVELFVRCPAADANYLKVLWRVKCDKTHTIQPYLARTILNAPTLTLVSVLNTHAVAINGLTFTAHTDTTTPASRQFSIAGDDTADAAALVGLINNATYGVPGVTAANVANVITLTATTATTTQCTTTVGATITCAQGTKINLLEHGDPYSGCAAITLTNGKTYEQYLDGFPQAYLGITNNDGAAAATMVVGATLFR